MDNNNSKSLDQEPLVAKRIVKTIPSPQGDSINKKTGKENISYSDRKDEQDNKRNIHVKGSKKNTMVRNFCICICWSCFNMLYSVVDGS